MSPRINQQAAGQVEEPLATEQDLDLRIIEDEPRTLTVPVNYYRVNADGELGEFVAREWVKYPVRKQMAIPAMTSLLRLETRINEALAKDDDAESDGELQKALTDSYRRIVSLIAEQTPHAFRIVETELDGEAGTVKVKPEIELDTTQVLATLAWISGDVSVADAVAKTITAGKTAARSKEDVEDGIARDEHGEPLGSAEASPDVPFPSSAP